MKGASWYATSIAIAGVLVALLAEPAQAQLSRYDEAQCAKLEGLTRQLLRATSTLDEASPVIAALRRSIQPIRTDLSLAHAGRSAEELCPRLREISPFDETQCARLENLLRQLVWLLPHANEASPSVVDLRRRIEPIRTDLAIAHPGRSIDAVCPGLPTPREPSVPAPIGQPA